MNKPPTLMLIDDDADDVMIFTEAAREIDKDIVCITANDGIAALKYLTDPSNLLPDYIFLDLRMPKMSGQKCIEEIKKIDALLDIPVFAYSTSTDEEDIRNLEKKGAVMFITKPTDPDEIYYVLSNILGEKWKNLKVKE